MSRIKENWEWFRGRDTTYKKVIRRNQRLIKKAIKRMEKDESKLEKERKKQTEKLYRIEQKNELDVVRVWTNDLDRLKGQENKILKMKQQLQSVSTNLLIMKSQLRASEAVYQVLQKLNKSLNMPQMQVILMRFEKHAAQVMKHEKEVKPVGDVAVHGGESEAVSEIVEMCIKLSQDSSRNILGVIEAVPKHVRVTGPEPGSSSMGDEQMGINKEIEGPTQRYPAPYAKKDVRVIRSYFW